MIHEIGVELRAYFACKGCPFPVVDGPERRGTVTYARERVVIEHDEGDAFTSRHQTDKNPRTRLTRNMACKITIYAKNPRQGAPYWEHVRRLEHVLDMVLIGIDVIAKQRKNLCVFRSGKFVYPEDLQDGETPGGAAYELLFSFDRGVANRNWDGTADGMVTVTEGFILTQVLATGFTADGGVSTELASGTSPLPAPVVSFASQVGTVGGVTTITGTGFLDGSSVSIAGSTVQSFWLSPTSFLAMAPALDQGTYNVLVTSPNGQNSGSTGNGALTVSNGAVAPTLTSLSQTGGTVTGETIVNLVGTGFTQSMISNVGTLSDITSTTAKLTTGPHIAGTVDVAVTNLGGTSNGLPYTFLPLPGTITFTPNTGLDNATTAVTFVMSNDCLPYGLTGVSSSLTVGGLALTDVTYSSASAGSGTIPSGGTDGAADAVIEVDAATGTTEGAYTFRSPVPVPTLVAPAKLLLFGALGGGPAVTWPGTGLTGCTAVHVGSQAVTPISSTSTSVTFVWPANAASDTPYAITATTSGGTSSPIAGAYAVPASILHLWYASEFFASTWVDVVGGAALAPGAGQAMPPLGTVDGGSMPAAAFGASGHYGLTVALSSLAQPGSLGWVGNLTSTSPASQVAIDGTTANPSSRWALFYETTTMCAFTTGVFSGVTVGTGAASYEALFDASNTTTFARTTIAATSATGFIDESAFDGITVGTDSSFNEPLEANVAIVYVAQNISSGDRTTWNAIVSALVGTV